MQSRITALAARPRHTLGALAVVLAAVSVAVGSSASFTTHAASATQTYAAGSLSITGPGASAILSADNLIPGDTRTGVTDVQNSGSVEGRFTLDATDKQGSDLLLDGLELSIRDCGRWTGLTAPACDASDPMLYTGAVSGLVVAQPGDRLTLGLWQAGDKHRYEFTTTLPAGSGDEFQGLSGSVVFNWYAVAGS